MKYLKIIPLLLLMLFPVWLMPDGVTIRNFPNYWWTGIPILLPASLVLLVAAMLLYFLKFRPDREEMLRIAGLLTSAERDFLVNLNSGQSHGGRKSNAEERFKWSTMGPYPALQVNMAGFRSVTHDLVDSNEKELQGKGTAMGKAGITGYLLKELYLGSVSSAQRKVLSDTLNNGKPPYLAPGIKDLIGFPDDFDPKKGFEEKAGVNEILLAKTVKRMKFPHLKIYGTDSEGNERIIKEGWEVLKEVGLRPEP